MKYNLVQDKEKLISLYPHIEAVFDLKYLQALPFGKTEINEYSFCIKTEYNMRNCEEQFFESHRKYIDIHITLSGFEHFAITPIDKLVKTRDYNKKEDSIIYDRNSKIDKIFCIQENELVIFGVNDGHMSAFGDPQTNVKKVIVKVLDESISN